MKEIWVKNLITNGNVWGSMDGWAITTEEVEHEPEEEGGEKTTETIELGKLDRVPMSDGTYALKLSATADHQNMSLECKETLPLIRSHKYYLSFRVAQYNDATRAIKAFWPNDAKLPVGISTTPKAGTWYRAASIISLAYETSGMYPIRFEVTDAPSTQYALFNQLMLVDLTEAFGAGYEPTVEWCNENIEYFEGSVALPFWWAVALDLQAEVMPDEVAVNGNVKIIAHVDIKGTLYELAPLYSGEVFAGEA